MKKPTTLRPLSLIACSGIAALMLSTASVAQHSVGHAGTGFHGGYHGGYGWRGGYGGRGGYGWRGGYGFYGPWGWGGLGLGLYFATLPLYYSTFWWEGVPYYADNTYYRWNGTVNQYETVSPPLGLQDQAAPRSPVESALIVYPKVSQSQEQQGKDKFECHRWAASQTGFDPTQWAGATASGMRSEYFRAQAACLEGRGYTVK